MIEQCHEECGPIVVVPETIFQIGHVHENEDGRCYHQNEDEDDDTIILNIGEGV